MVQTVMNHVDGVQRAPKKAINITRGGLANGNNRILPATEVTDKGAGIRHPQPIIFSRYMERSEIMNGRHDGTRALPDHASITGNVENIEPKLPSEPWKPRLMPPNIPDRRAIFLRDNTNLHLGR